MDYLKEMLDAQQGRAVLPFLRGFRAIPAREEYGVEQESAAEVSAALETILQSRGESITEGRTVRITAEELPRGETSEASAPEESEASAVGRREAFRSETAEEWSPEELSRYFERDARRYG